MSNQTQAQIRHALTKLTEISHLMAEGRGEPRDLFQYGYNAGRLAELSGKGRAVWDILKGYVADGDWISPRYVIEGWEAQLLAEDWDENPETNPAATR